MVSIAAQLNERGIRTQRGGSWHVSSVANVLARANECDVSFARRLHFPFIGGKLVTIAAQLNEAARYRSFSSRLILTRSPGHMP